MTSHRTGTISRSHTPSYPRIRWLRTTNKARPGGLQRQTFSLLARLPAAPPSLAFLCIFSPVFESLAFLVYLVSPRSSIVSLSSQPQMHPAPDTVLRMLQKCIAALQQKVSEHLGLIRVHTLRIAPYPSDQLLRAHERERIRGTIPCSVPCFWLSIYMSIRASRTRKTRARDHAKSDEKRT